ncbi:beta-1,4-N-acetylgalactosaminyltransferase bre-4-like [Ixodes scapularis]|uniref:beta-1,4-N-acetylgalactosaminyltransferase bre-4-like n=1 Tax=Ixodes scapularis TaxID=6945 RepID=UPI001AD78367|nr:beta-1,4-N-acetylgalactosaminyltransferase bre-4-like [Ixodes scapularis]
MHQFLRRQELDYRIYIIEQVAHTSFNRGKLLNVGYDMAERLHGHSCFVLHDVDLLPENDLNLYTCDQFPKHMSSCIDKMKYRLPYETIFGGVSAMRAAHFKHINGFSNIFWGWGGEDDDVSTRIRFSGLPIIHANCSVARYTSLNHKQEQPNAKRFKLIRRTMFRIKKDGLNTLSYRVVDFVLTRLYTHVTVDLLQRK